MHVSRCDNSHDPVSFGHQSIFNVSRISSCIYKVSFFSNVCMCKDFFIKLFFFSFYKVFFHTVHSCNIGYREINISIFLIYIYMHAHVHVCMRELKNKHVCTMIMYALIIIF